MKRVEGREIEANGGNEKTLKRVEGKEIEANGGNEKQ